MNKKKALIAIAIALALFFYRRALGAEGSFVKYMVDLHKGESISQVKGLGFGYQSELSIFETKLEGGFFIDNTGIENRKSGAFGSASIGVEPTSGALYVHFFQGVGAISSPDSALGGPFQFFEDVGIGMRDQKTKVSLGLLYKHISSAGIYTPNVGRDLGGFQVMIPW